MKLHWGNILVIAFIAFGGMIIYLVYKSMNSNYDMVSKEYYKEELGYQQIIDAANRTVALKDSISYHADQRQLVISLPADIHQNEVEADAHFYCAYDAKKDRKMKVNFKNGISAPIFLSEIGEGIYTLKLKFNANGQQYYQEKPISIAIN